MSGDQLQFGDDERSIALRRAWDRALHILQSKVNKATFESYIKPVRPLSLDHQEVTLGVASPFAREWLDKRYSPLIATTLSSLLGCPISLRFHVLSQADLADHAAAMEGAEETGKKEHPAAALPKSRSGRISSGERFFRPDGITSLPLNEKYTLESFVVGKSNRLAHAGATAVAAEPGAVYNPLFVYGAPGLGKTHLLHAMGNALLSQDGNARVAFVDGESFTYHYVTALRERKTEDFRKYYRNIDMWLVDDIQFIAGKEQTKEEFFHTFNALYQSGKQIVISSDRSPRELREMDERLRSRFECGLIADIASPDLETRMAILQRRAIGEKWDLSAEVVYYIANAIRSNIRALEGALTKLVAYASVMGLPICIDLAQSVLGEYLIERPVPSMMRKGISFDMILSAVAEQFQLPVAAIRGERRDRQTVTARQAAMLLCRQMTGCGLATIGKAIGGREHTTVQRGIAKIENQMEQDEDLRNAVQEARDRLDR
jgi:chromosomal replication initiator protein